MKKIFYERKLPHFQPPGATFFVTYRLAGSIPMQQLKIFHDEYMRLQAELFTKDLSNEMAAMAKQSLQWAYFERVDSFADNNPNGPYWLKDNSIANWWLIHFIF